MTPEELAIFNHEETTMKKYTSKEFIDYCDNKYPALKENENYRKMFLHLCFSTYISYENYNLLIPYELLHNVAGKNIKYYNKANNKFVALRFLKDFKKDVLPDFEWTEAVMKKENTWEAEFHCRTVANRGFDEETRSKIKEELNFEGQKYHFVTGLTYNRHSIAKDRREAMDQFETDYKLFNLNPTQQLIYDSIKGVSHSGKAFLLKLTENEERINKAINNLKGTIIESKEEAIERQSRIRESIREDPRIFYYPTPLKRTPRLHAGDDTVLGFKREVRKAFCIGWTECDLRSSQFIILSYILDSKPAIELIKSRKNLWKYIHTVATGSTEPPTHEQKSVYKETIYGICFGQGAKRLKELLEANNISSLLNDPIIADLLVKRAEWFQRIRQNGYITDVWGETHKLEEAGRVYDMFGNYVYAKERWEGSLAATKIQSIEMEVISSIFEFQNECSEAYNFKIMLFQHDGVCISFNEKKHQETVQKKMNEALKRKAVDVGNKIGIDLSEMELEFDDLR